MFLRFKQGSIKEEYFFDRKVGHGGFGIVYKAKNRITLKTVAIKAIQKFKLNDINLFKNEYNILMDLDHPNIINIHEIWGVGKNDVFSNRVLQRRRFVSVYP